VKGEKMKEPNIPAKVSSILNVAQPYINMLVRSHNIPRVKPDYTEQIKQLVLAGGKNQTEIASIVGCSVSLVNSIIKNNNLPYVKTNYAPKILELHNTTDKSIEEIAESLGCSVSYVNTVIGTFKDLRFNKNAT
jgi:DNA-binding CsgD family transcriptional regulator